MMSHKTYGVKYIGSKREIIPYIHALVSKLKVDDKKFIDVFTGTTRVSQAFRQDGWKIISSDLAWASEVYAELFLNTRPSDIRLLRQKCEELDKLTVPSLSEGDWITKYYSGLSSGTSSIKSCVWKPHNTTKADMIRNKIEEWVTTKKITKSIAKKLVAVLIMAMDSVDNTVGVQQAYLKDWAKRTSKPLNLLSKIPVEDWKVWSGPRGKFILGNALTIEYPKADVAYIDPPYTTHSYSTYYHIWDSITKWDKPEVGLTTNRRIDRISKSSCHDKSMVSSWNKKKDVISSFQKLIDRLPVSWILISYSNESLVNIEELTKGIKDMKCVKSLDFYSVDHKRNIMANIGNGENPANHRNVKEYILVLEKVPDPDE